jgi:hypothetical protein
MKIDEKMIDDIFNLKIKIKEKDKIKLSKYQELIPTFVAFYVVWGKSAHIHKDSDPSSTRVNFPILNCKGTITNFYKNVIFKKYTNPVTGVISYPVTNTDYELVDNFETKTATLIRVHEAHNVVVPKNLPVPRITMTVGFNKDPVFLFDN